MCPQHMCVHGTWSRMTPTNNVALRDNTQFLKWNFDALQKTVLLIFSLFCQGEIANCIFGALPLSKN